jgi:ankyrin repeat domain-containing protein 50
MNSLIRAETLKEQNDFLNLLSSKEKHAHELEVATQHEGTCQWITHTHQFEHWNSGSELSSPILFVLAPLGWGKSVLAKFIFRSLAEKNSAKPNQEVLGFFCKGFDGRNTASDIVKYFLSKLLEPRRELLSRVLPDFTGLGNLDATPSFRSLWAIFIEVMSDPGLANVRLIVDGLDECTSESQMEFLKALETSFREQPRADLKGRLIITSRPTLKALEVANLYSLLHIQVEDVAPDISTLVRSKVGMMAETRGYPDETSSKIIERLEKRADGMFLWVNLVLEELNSDDHPDTKSTIDKTLDRLPESLHEFYTRNLMRISGSVRDDAWRIFEILLVAGRVLKPAELAVASTNWPLPCPSHAELSSEIPINMGRFAKRVCGSLVKVGDDHITFVHQSTREFLVTKSEETHTTGDFIYNPAAAHLRMSKLCLRYILLEEFSHLETWQSPLLSDEYPFIDYAMDSLVSHLCEVDQMDEECLELLQRFLSEDCIQCRHWIISLYLRAFGSSTIQIPEFTYQSSILGALMMSKMPEIYTQSALHSQPSKSDAGYFDAISVLNIDFEVNALNCMGTTALFLATILNNEKGVEYLLSINADPSIVNYDGTTALHGAASTGDRKIATMLLEANADIKNSKSNIGNTTRKIFDIDLETDLSLQEKRLFTLRRTMEISSSLIFSSKMEQN